WRLLLDPLQIGPIRLLGVGFSGLSDVHQESLFGDLELSSQSPETHEAHENFETLRAALLSGQDAARWRIGDDIVHREFGHGWVQGAGHGVVTVRFETRASGTGIAKTFAESDEVLEVADAVDSLL